VPVKLRSILLTELKEEFTVSLGCSSISEALGLGSLALWLQLVEQAEELASLTLVESLLELVDCWRDLNALVQNAAGALDANVPVSVARSIREKRFQSTAANELE